VIGCPSAVLVRRRHSAYFNVMALSSQQQIMPQSRSAGGVGSAIARAIIWASAGLGGIVLLGALVLWFHYGTAVFFEMIASGVSACF
jgi:hypothetical protein